MLVRQKFRRNAGRLQGNHPCIIRGRERRRRQHPQEPEQSSWLQSDIGLPPRRAAKPASSTRGSYVRISSS